MRHRLDGDEKFLIRRELWGRVRCGRHGGAFSQLSFVESGGVTDDRERICSPAPERCTRSEGWPHPRPCGHQRATHAGGRGVGSGGNVGDCRDSRHVGVHTCGDPVGPRAASSSAHRRSRPPPSRAPLRRPTHRLSRRQHQHRRQRPRFDCTRERAPVSDARIRLDGSWSERGRTFDGPRTERLRSLNANARGCHRAHASRPDHRHAPRSRRRPACDAAPSHVAGHHRAYASCPDHRPDHRHAPQAPADPLCRSQRAGQRLTDADKTATPRYSRSGRDLLRRPLDDRGPDLDRRAA